MKIISQKGRSMVEMLGVLAIVGVLSVGAIAGYSKAMFKYKMNKTMDIISHAVSRVVELDTMRLEGVIYTAQHMIDYGIVPDCDVNYTDPRGQTGVSCQIPLGAIWLYLGQDGSNTMSGTLYITFSQEPFESCVAFFNSGIYKNVPEDWVGACAGNSGGCINLGEWEYIYDFELSNTDILDACESCKTGRYCQIGWVIRED